jgi:uncharacterized protein with ParB-like and HNH nuclease domain
MAKDTQKLSIELDGIGHAISDKKLMVPAFQRSYAWEEKHVKDLFQDLIASIKNSVDEYFIGSIVVAGGSELDEVVDGQQRLATITILISAIRDYFYTTGDKERAEDVQRKYLANRDIRTQETIPKLKLNNNDHDFFYKRVVCSPETREHGLTPSRESHQRLLKAYGLAKEHISAYLKTTHNPTETLVDLLEYLDNHLKIIWVRVPDHSNAFTIFETLNDRGLELAISDLLKNFLFGQSHDRMNETQSNWTEMYSLLESTENESLIVTFIRHYWSSIYGLTRERELYDEIKKKITSKQRAVDLSINLVRNSKVYVALIDSSNSYWAGYSDEVKANIGYINMFGMVQLRPLLLSIIAKFTRPEIIKSIKYLVSISVRFLIHGGLGGGALETQYSERAKEITEGDITKFSELIEKMKKAIPSDVQFEESFKIASVSKHYLARYYLICLEQIKNPRTELVPNSDTNAVNLEHILPKVPDSSWKVDEETHKLLYNRLGNLALLDARINSTSGNSSFKSKKSVYAKSAFKLTSELAVYQNWDLTAINQRQGNLAKLAVKKWPIS